MRRQPTTQQLTWFLDLNRNGQLDLNPPYQRRSVWSAKDKRFFLDTIFRNYPAPPIFIHRTIDDNGFTEYHVVDGKQRLETIIAFADSKIAISKDYGDENLNGKKFRQLDTIYKRKFWDYTLVVDFIDSIEGNNIEEVFDRVNRNAKNLQPQELRHARFDGWFINLVEEEAQLDFWWNHKISTRARDKRMKNIQFISELLMVLLSNTIHGFSQELIDSFYTTYDDIDELVDEAFEEADVIQSIATVKTLIDNMNAVNNCITNHAAGSNNHFYSLWALIYINNDIDPHDLALRYHEFMTAVGHLNEDNIEAEGLNINHKSYYRNSRGASTDLNQREARLSALQNELLG